MLKIFETLTIQCNINFVIFREYHIGSNLLLKEAREDDYYDLRFNDKSK